MSKRFATLNSLKGDDSKKHDSGSSDEDEARGPKPGERQSFYVGGGEHSGQEVLGPPGRKPEELVDKLFKDARKAGAQAPDEVAPSANAQPRSRAFQGAGRRLNSDDDVVEVPVEPPQPTQPRTVGPNQVTVAFRLWQNGFSLDDGPLREYNDPASRRFMESIQRGQIPSELTTAHPGCEIDLTMERHVNEEYKPPPMKPFSGQGTRLGAVVPGVEGAPAPEPVIPTPGPSEPTPAPEAAPTPKLDVDESKPKGTIGVRLTDGKTIKLTVNQSHTVGDVRRAICQALPALAMNAFVFHSSYPKKQIEDETQSLGDAQLLNSVIIMRVTG